MSSLLLLGNGVGALYGGTSFILHPDGSGLHITVDWLKHTPFHDYLIPGIILLAVNGIFSLFVFMAVILKRWKYPWLVMVQGVLLGGWILIQVLLIQSISSLHIIFFSLGFTLLILGYLILGRIESKSN